MPSVPLNALRTFEAAARHLSFSRAAEELNVTTAAVSSQIRALEERLNQPLFRRSGRRVSLTAAGRKLFPGVQRGMKELRQAVQRVDADRSSGALNVSMMPAFLQKWLMPRLGDFQANHGDIDLRISADDALVDFDTTDFHAAIRFGPGDPSSPPGVRLMGDWILPVCSPRYFERHGPVRDLDDLAGREMMYVDSDALDAWFRFVDEDARDRRVKVLNDALAILMAAELGEGIALTRWSLVARDLAAGRFVRPVPTAVPSDWCYWFVAPSHQQDMPKVRAFRSWLAEECAQFERAGPASTLNVTD